MEIHEERVFLFKFQTDGGDVQFPIRATTREEALDKIQKMLGRIQAEIAMEIPKTIKTETQIPKLESAVSSTPIPPEVLEMRIDTLLGDMGAGQLKGKAKADTIKQWTGIEFTEANYTHIVTELELIRTGQKEIPAKKSR